MKFVTDPSTLTKIERMKQRVRWRDQTILQRGIDQTKLVLEDGQDDAESFSFLVLGDSGTGAHRGYDPQRRIAEMMVEQREDCRFVLHTGDVVYLVGSSEYYWQNFILPYREFLVGGEALNDHSSRSQHIRYDQMQFNQPFLPVLGNHDYYDLPIAFGALAQSFYPLRKLLRSRVDFDIGWHGSFQGGAFAKAFIDCLSELGSDQALGQHLDRHYTAQSGSDRCLSYQPKLFTRLPNRYYSFCAGGIDFFALDSNTFNAPAPLPDTPQGRAYRQVLEQRRREVTAEKQALVQQLVTARADHAEEDEQIDDQRTKVEQLEEVERDLDRQLETRTAPIVDQEQLDWLAQRLIQSWHDDKVRGRVLFFHHPPYVTEASKWHQAQTLAVRQRLRQVFEKVTQEIAGLQGDRPVVDLILNGHAHCMEHLRTEASGLADAGIDCLVCGGSGYSLRRQRVEGNLVNEMVVLDNKVQTVDVARSHLFVGRNGQGSEKRRPYSFLRIDVQEGNPPRYVVRPFVAEWYHRRWNNYPLQPFTLP